MMFKGIKKTSCFCSYAGTATETNRGQRTEPKTNPSNPTKLEDTLDFQDCVVEKSVNSDEARGFP